MIKTGIKTVKRKQKKTNTKTELVKCVASSIGARFTDVNGATSRAVLFDFCKALDLSVHHVLVQKLSSYDFPESIMCSRVKLSCVRVSE